MVVIGVIILFIRICIKPLIKDECDDSIPSVVWHVGRITRTDGFPAGFSNVEIIHPETKTLEVITSLFRLRLSNAVIKLQLNMLKKE